MRLLICLLLLVGSLGAQSNPGDIGDAKPVFIPSSEWRFDLGATANAWTIDGLWDHLPLPETYKAIYIDVPGKGVLRFSGDVRVEKVVQQWPIPKADTRINVPKEPAYDGSFGLPNSGTCWGLSINPMRILCE